MDRVERAFALTAATSFVVLALGVALLMVL